MVKTRITCGAFFYHFTEDRYGLFFPKYDKLPEKSPFARATLRVPASFRGAKGDTYFWPASSS